MRLPCARLTARVNPTILGAMLRIARAADGGQQRCKDVAESHGCNPSLPLHSVQSKCGSGQAQFATASSFAQQPERNVTQCG